MGIEQRLLCMNIEPGGRDRAGQAMDLDATMADLAHDRGIDAGNREIRMARNDNDVFHVGRVSFIESVGMPMQHYLRVGA